MSMKKRLYALERRYLSVINEVHRSHSLLKQAGVRFEEGEIDSFDFAEQVSRVEEILNDISGDAELKAEDDNDE